MARLVQKRSRLSVPPNKVVNIVRSTSTISPARLPLGGIQRNELNSRLPASVNGCGCVISQYTNELCIVCRQGVVRQMRVEVEGRDAGKPTACIQVPHRCQRRN